MITVDKNTFYKRVAIDKAIAVRPNYSDLPEGGIESLVKLQGGTDSVLYLLSGAVAATPAYGESKLIGGNLQLYCSGVTMTTSPTIPQLSLYKVQKNVSISEGTLKPSYDAADNTSGSPVTGSSVGANVAVYRSAVNKDSIYMNENFDGADKALGEVKMIRSIGNGTIELDDAYLTQYDARKQAIHLGNIAGQRKEHAINNYFTAGGVVPIEPKKGTKNKMWIPRHDTRKGQKKYIWRSPEWQLSKIKDKMKFKMQTASASTPEMEPLASAGNTIFDEVYATADTNNPFTSDEANPLMMTSCELSTAKKFSGGQAFRMYHLWDYSTMSAYLQKALGARAIVPSMTRASIYNIPRPHPGLDVAYRGNLKSGVYFRGMQAAAVPEINIKMNIAKMGFAPYMQYDASTTKTKAYALEDATDSTNLATGSSIFTAADDTITTLLRGVFVTFSNYKPKTDHTTLDKFIAYGTNRFHAGETSEHIVGGIAFLKTGIDGVATSDPSSLSCTALPLTKIYGGAATGQTTGILGTKGMCKFTMNSSTDLKNTFLLGTNFWEQQYNQDNSTAALKGLRNVSIPMDSWFDMTVCIDAYAKMSAATSLNDPYSAAARTVTGGGIDSVGSPMRVYFKTQTTVSGSTDAEASVGEVPYVDVIFPCEYDGSAGYSFNDTPANYPQHMTIWVQNYRWIKGSNALGFETSEANFHYGDNGSATSDYGPLPSGAAIEAEVFIDDITLKNFTPTISNATAGASISKSSPLTMKSDDIATPFTTFVSGTAFVRSWAQTGSTVTKIRTKPSTECVTFGYDSPTIFPTGNYTSTASGYMLASGFSTHQFGVLSRTTEGQPSSLYPMGAFVSTSGSNSYATSQLMGGQFHGNHSWTTADVVERTASLEDATVTLTGTHTYTTKGGACNGLVNLMTGAATLPSQDAFTSKGLMKFEIDNTFNADAGWTKREHIMASTKILAFSGLPSDTRDLTSLQLLVDDPSIFNQYLDEEYVIYKMSSLKPTVATGNANTLGWGVATTTNNYTSIKLSADTGIDGDIVTFDVNTIGSGSPANTTLELNRLADDSSTGLFTEANLPDLWISPKKYWLTLFQPANVTPRSYQNFMVIQNVDADGVSNITPTAAAFSGSTWNEFSYGYNASAAANVGQNGLYTKMWNLDTDIETSTLVLNKDYGYGNYDEETQEGGEVGKLSAIPGEYLNFNMMPLASSKETNSGDSIVLMLGLSPESTSNTVNIVGDEFGTVGDTKRPYMFWQYKDNLPEITSPLNVEPNVNILSGSGADKVDLYNLNREELNSLKFTWEEQGDDVLYRLLYVDTAPILDKYDGTYFWAPLNEVPGNDSKIKGYYYSGSTTIGTEFSSVLKSVRDITGPCGWAFDGNAEKSTGGNYPLTNGSIAWGWHGKTEATFIAHGVPNATGTNTSGSLFNDYDNNYGSFDIWYSKAASANANVTPKVTLVSGATTFSGKTYTLTSDYSFVNDGESPLFVVVTFDSTLDYDRIKMYVNGFLAASSKGDWVQDRTLYDGTGYTGQINIGSGWAGITSRFHGLMSECMVHSRCLHVPTQANQYIMSTASLPDMAGKAASDTEVKYNAKLFLFDYHNIIGSSSDRVASSTEVTWEATGI